MGEQKAIESGFGPGAMGYLAPQRFSDEALSGWLVRIAHAHYLTLEELLSLTSLCWYRLDRGDPQHLQSLSTMLGTTVGAPGLRLGRVRDARTQSPAWYWVVCPVCLNGDVANNRAPYIRSGWFDPFATYCVEHNMPLMPQIKRDPFGSMFGEVTDMFDGSAHQYLRDLDAHDMAALRTFALDVGGSVSKSTAQMIREVSDVAAALMLPVRRAFPYSVVHKLNTRSGRRSILWRGTDFEPNTIWSSWSPGRLGLLRAALSLLEPPGEPREEGGGLHDYGRRLTARRKRISAPGQSISDPLLFLPMALSPAHRTFVTERSVAWRPPMRVRWQDCLALTEQLRP